MYWAVYEAVTGSFPKDELKLKSGVLQPVLLGRHSSSLLPYLALRRVIRRQASVMCVDFVAFDRYSGRPK